MKARIAAFGATSYRRGKASLVFAHHQPDLSHPLKVGKLNSSLFWMRKRFGSSFQRLAETKISATILTWKTRTVTRKGRETLRILAWVKSRTTTLVSVYVRFFQGGSSAIEITREKVGT